MQDGRYIRTLRIIFENKISNNEIPLFRGAVLSSMQQQGNILFHNHISNNTFRYSYPLIQYKKINSLASIVAIDKGVDIVGEFLNVGGYFKDFSNR